MCGLTDTWITSQEQYGGIGLDLAATLFTPETP